MGTKKHFDIVLLIYTLFVSMLLISPVILASNSSDCEIVTKVFHSSGAEIARLQVNGWVTVKASDIDQDSAEAYLNHRIHGLSEFGFTGIVENGHDGQSSVLVTEGTIDPGIYIRVVLKNAVDFDESGGGLIYLTASVAAQNRSLNLVELNKYLLLIMPEQNIHRSVVLTGSLPGKTSPSEVNDIVREMVYITDAQNVQILETGGLVSISAYSPSVRQRLTFGESSVNINIALRYNSIENRTYLYVGSPIISNEY